MTDRTSRIVTAPILTDLGVRHGFSTRVGGVSAPPYGTLNVGRAVGDDEEAVEENLRLLAGDGRVDRFYMVSQVHGDRVLEVGPDTDPEALRHEEADALATGTLGRAVAVRTADCVPILLAAPDVGAVAAVHAGWRGTVARIAAAAVAFLSERYGAAPEHLRAAIGPSIRSCCYEVGEEVAGAFTGDLCGAVLRRSGARPHLDLQAANAAVLRAAGVPASAIEDLGLCTACEAERFFSHRRDRGRTGRHLSFVAPPREWFP